MKNDLGNVLSVIGRQEMSFEQLVFGNVFRDLSISVKKSTIKAGLHRNANTNVACKNNAYAHVGKFVDCSAFAEAANRPYINVLYANSLWRTDSRRITFGCSPNIRHTAECCLPRLRNTSTSDVCIIFACHIRVLFVFRCKYGFKRNRSDWKIRKKSVIDSLIDDRSFIYDRL